LKIKIKKCDAINVKSAIPKMRLLINKEVKRILNNYTFIKILQKMQKHDANNAICIAPFLEEGSG